jgi:hypothetical protein
MPLNNAKFVYKKRKLLKIHLLHPASVLVVVHMFILTVKNNGLKVEAIKENRVIQYHINGKSIYCYNLDSNVRFVRNSYPNKFVIME